MNISPTFVSVCVCLRIDVLVVFIYIYIYITGWEFWFNLRELTVYRYNSFKGNNDAVDEDWDDSAVDAFYKEPISKWLSDEELARDNKNYYVV